jgi:hypothetical protein
VWQPARRWWRQQQQQQSRPGLCINILDDLIKSVHWVYSN